MMKKLIFAVIIALAIPFTAQAQTFVDTTLTTPLVVVPPATLARQYSYTRNPDSFHVQFNFIADDSTISSQRTCILDGQDFLDAINAVIVCPTMGGKKFDNLIRNFLQTRCKAKLALTGTE